MTRIPGKPIMYPFEDIPFILNYSKKKLRILIQFSAQDVIDRSCADSLLLNSKLLFMLVPCTNEVMIDLFNSFNVFRRPSRFYHLERFEKHLVLMHKYIWHI